MRRGEGGCEAALSPFEIGLVRKAWLSTPTISVETRRRPHRRWRRGRAVRLHGVGQGAPLKIDHLLTWRKGLL